MNTRLLLAVLFSLIGSTTFAQQSFKPDHPKGAPAVKSGKLHTTLGPAMPRHANFFDVPLDRFSAMEYRPATRDVPALGSPFRIRAFSPQGTPGWVSGRLDATDRSVALEDQAFLYLDALKAYMHITDPAQEFQITSIHQGTTGKTHIRMDQYYKGLPVYGGEVILHAEQGQISGLNGSYYPTPGTDVNPSVSQTQAMAIVKADLGSKTTIRDLTYSGLAGKLLPDEPVKSRLIIYHTHEDQQPHLAWQVDIYPNVTEQWRYMIDAHTGDILFSGLNSCKLAGDFPKISTREDNIPANDRPKRSLSSPAADPLTPATGMDLNGVMRSFETYQQGGTYYLIDITRPMYNAAASSLPDDPAGAIFTIDANNTDPQTNNFQVSHLTNNSTTWNNPKAVSAHYNAGIAYDYYRNTFNRNSINGQGGTIISIINVSENGQGMDNAFWNGQAMFYGNGNQAFKPLAGALDVAGHEMSHGVIGATANLKYQYESGAINESFADIFGAMIDRDDWQMGEDVVLPGVFPSGALRDLSNPHNGGSGLGSPGWQPAHVSEMYTGSQDNGGVHINSGICNKAFYLFATQVGKDKAEQVYYKALTDYLTKSSQFKDLRIAVLNAATDLYGANSAEVAQVGPAFDAVGITGPSSGGGGGPTPGDLQPNPGQDFIVFLDPTEGYKIGLAQGNGNVFQTPLSQFESYSHPSVTDNGSDILYIDPSNNIQHISIDWNNNSYNEETLDDAGDNRNVAIAPDGSRMAVVTTAYDNKIWVYDFGLGAWQSFDLYNPTSQGTKTYNVDYADVLQFDYSGQYIMYDARSTIQNQGGQDISYWDIGFIHVWDGAGNTWADGQIDKLFSALPDNTSVGNPTFAKNSPYIIAFDLLEGNNTFLAGANIEFGESENIVTNDTLGRPSYAPSDQRIAVTTRAGAGSSTTKLASIPVKPTKYQYDPTPGITTLINPAGWGTWFANGSRPLVIGTEDITVDDKMALAPNPFVKSFSIRALDSDAIPTQILVYNVNGQLVRKIQPTGKVTDIQLVQQPPGLYVVKVIDTQGRLRLFRAIKQ